MREDKKKLFHCRFSGETGSCIAGDARSIWQRTYIPDTADKWETRVGWKRRRERGRGREFTSLGRPRTPSKETHRTSHTAGEAVHRDTVRLTVFALLARRWEEAKAWDSSEEGTIQGCTGEGKRKIKVKVAFSVTPTHAASVCWGEESDNANFEERQREERVATRETYSGALEESVAWVIVFTSLSEAGDKARSSLRREWRDGGGGGGGEDEGEKWRHKKEQREEEEEEESGKKRSAISTQLQCKRCKMSCVWCIENEKERSINFISGKVARICSPQGPALCDGSCMYVALVFVT